MAALTGAAFRPEHFLWQMRGAVAVITLDRPEKKNPLTFQAYAELRDTFRALTDCDDVKAVVVTGAGRAFVAGADIEEISGLDAQTGLAFARRGQGVFSRIERLEKPVIAAVNGFALGGGCELAMACHMRIASSRAKCLPNDQCLYISGMPIDE